MASTKSSSYPVPKEQNIVPYDVTFYKCDECGAQFKRKQILKRHKQALHSSIRFFCKECERSFTHRTNLIRHILVMHYNARRWLCGLCALGYCHSADLRKHLKVAHSLLLPALNNLLKKSRDEVYIFPELDTFTIDETVRLKLANLCVEEEKKYESAVTSGSLDHVYPKIKEKVSNTVDSEESFIHITCDNPENQEDANELLNSSVKNLHEGGEDIISNPNYNQTNIIQLIQPFHQNTIQHTNTFYEHFPSNRMIFCESAVENNPDVNYQHKTIPINESELYSESRSSLTNVSIIPMISYQCSICHLTFLTNQSCLYHIESEHQVTTQPTTNPLSNILDQCVRNILPIDHFATTDVNGAHTSGNVAVQYPSDANIAYTYLSQPTKGDVSSESIEVTEGENIYSVECPDLQRNLNDIQSNSKSKTELFCENGFPNFSDEKSGNYEMELVVDEIDSENPPKKKEDVLDFQCDVCNSSFLTKKKLSRHKKIHSPAKHKCNSCQKSFFEKSNLQKHLKTHQDDALVKHTCQQCDKTYRHAKDLKDHIRRVHATEGSISQRIVCSLCSTHFTRKPHLLRHLRNVHSVSSNQLSDLKTNMDK